MAGFNPSGKPPAFGNFAVTRHLKVGKDKVIYVFTGDGFLYEVDPSKPECDRLVNIGLPIQELLHNFQANSVALQFMPDGSLFVQGITPDSNSVQLRFGKVSRQWETL